MTATATESEPGVLRTGEVLTVKAAQRALGVREWGWRQISKRVPTIKVGRQRYVLSDDLISLFRELREGQQ